MNLLLNDFQKKLKQIVPNLDEEARHKGQNGKIGVIGGCEEYTGAPYYSAISILKGGGDLAHIFCQKNAGIPIKSYSPEIIVQPYLVSQSDCLDSEKEEEKKKCLANMQKWIDPIHGFVVGPGLGRDNFVSEYLINFLESLTHNKILVLDADGLWLLGQIKIQTVQKIFNQKQQNIILTPNQIEFERLFKVFFPNQNLTLDRNQRNQKQTEFKQQLTENFIQEINIDHELVVDVVLMAQKFGNINIIHKGLVDILTNGLKCFIVSNNGSQKRCGGIGDILSGLTCLYCFWAQQNGKQLSDQEKTLNGCILSCYITRVASQKAYQKHKYSLTAPNIIEEIGCAFNEFYFSKL